MKANELRIKNLVRNNMNGEILIPCDILCDGINTENFEGFNYGFIEPIPLTEKWLSKTDLQKLGTRNIWHKDNFGVYYHAHFDPYSNLQKGCFYLVITDYVNNVIHTNFELKHIHQLQNLYFALTSKELTFKSE